MAKYIGVDWATKGWFGVILRDDGTWDSDLFPSIWSLWKYHSDADRICIDVPIGLPDDGPRQCDREAKSLLGDRRQTVFYAPIRDAVYEVNLAAAKERNEAAGYSIQNQVWSIVPRIRELDEFLDEQPSARDRLVETHPELCFYALNGRTPVADSKITKDGLEARKRLLREEDEDAGEIIETIRERFMEPVYAPFLSTEHDILDALVAAFTARRSEEELSRLPDTPEPPRDRRGLAMQLVYPSETTQTRLTSLVEETTSSDAETASESEPE
jgi:predicted RNase H-like nuclease